MFRLKVMEKRHMLAPAGELQNAPRGNAYRGESCDGVTTCCMSRHICKGTQLCHVIAVYTMSATTRLRVSPWSLVSVALAAKQQLCNHVLLSRALSVPEWGTRTRGIHPPLGTLPWWITGEYRLLFCVLAETAFQISIIVFKAQNFGCLLVVGWTISENYNQRKNDN